MKTETLVARVTPELAQKVVAAAKDAGEAEAFIVREALREYFARRETTPSASPDALRDSSSLTPAEKAARDQAVQVAQAAVNYSKRKPQKKNPK